MYNSCDDGVSVDWTLYLKRIVNVFIQIISKKKYVSTILSIVYA